MVNLFFAILWLWERLWNLSGNLQVRPLEGSVQFGQNTVIFFAARLIGRGLVIVPVGYGADAGRHQGALPQADAAVALAIHCAESVDRFAALMNEKAEALGLKHTHFVNPHGLHHPDHYTSAYDLAVIASEAMQNPDFAKIVGTKAIRITGSEEAGERYLVNKNKILTQYPGGNGVKTGFTTDAGRCLIAASVRDGMQVVAVVLNKYDMWEACSRLMDSAHENYQMQEVLSENEILAEASCDEKLKPASVALMAKSGFRYPLKKDGSESVSIVTKGVCGIVKPMPRGADNGIAEIYFDNRLIFSTKLITMDMVEKKGFWERMFPSASDETQ